MKKTYLQPTMMVVRLQQQSIICTSKVSSVSTNLDEGDAIGYGGGGTGPARVKSNTVDWDDDWSE
jgi:hypothetical protein